MTTQFRTLARDELETAVADYLAKRIGSAVQIHGITTTVSLDPLHPSVQVEFSPVPQGSERAHLNFALDPTDPLP